MALFCVDFDGASLYPGGPKVVCRECGYREPEHGKPNADELAVQLGDIEAELDDPGTNGIRYAQLVARRSTLRAILRALA